MGTFSPQSLFQHQQVCNFCNMDMTVASVVTSLLFSNVHGYEAEMESRQFTIPLQNVSLVITYTGIVVAALMMAGFMYIAVNYGRGRARYGHGYSRYGQYDYDDYYEDGDYYDRRSLRSKQGIPARLSELFSHLNKYDDEEE